MITAEGTRSSFGKGAAVPPGRGGPSARAQRAQLGTETPGALLPHPRGPQRTRTSPTLGTAGSCPGLSTGAAAPRVPGSRAQHRDQRCCCPGPCRGGEGPSAPRAPRRPHITMGAPGLPWAMGSGAFWGETPVSAKRLSPKQEIILPLISQSVPVFAVANRVFRDSGIYLELGARDKGQGSPSGGCEGDAAASTKNPSGSTARGGGFPAHGKAKGAQGMGVRGGAGASLIP